MDFNFRDEFQLQPGGDTVESKFGTLEQVVNAFIDPILIVTGIILLVSIIVFAIRLAFSSGDPSKLTKAKNNFLFSVMGFVIVIAAFVIVQVIKIIFGLQDIVPIVPA